MVHKTVLFLEFVHPLIPVSDHELPSAIHTFISRYVRSVEQLEILILFCRKPEDVWSVQQVYDVILSTPKSVERWLDELVRSGLLEKVAEPDGGYRCCTKDGLISQITALEESYRTKPVRVIESIYQRDGSAAQSFADAFKIKNTDQSS